MKKKQDPAFMAGVAYRLNALLRAKNLKDAEVARKLRLKPQTWGNYTQGTRPLPITVALELVKEFGVSLDWIYRGERASMPAGLLARIDALHPSIPPAHIN